MLTEDQQAKIAIIREFPEVLETAVSHLTDDQLNANTITDEWNIRQIVHHMADSHINSFVRLKLILTEEHPPLKPYAEPLWAKTADVSDVPVEVSITLLKGLHHRWTVLLESLTDAQWQRTGFHSELNQTLTPLDLLDIYSKHCTDHLEQIERTLRSK